MDIKIQEHMQRVLKRVRQYSVSQHEGCFVALLLGTSVSAPSCLRKRLWAKPSYRPPPPHIVVAMLLFRSTCPEIQFAQWCCKEHQNYALSPSNNTFAVSPQQGLCMALLIFSPSVGSKNWFLSPSEIKLYYQVAMGQCQLGKIDDKSRPKNSSVLSCVQRREILFQKK